MTYDIIIIGAGVVGGAVARDLSRRNLSILCFEKEADVCCGVSKSNTGIIHTPCLVKGPSKKASLNLRGNLMYPSLAEELGVEVQWPGALILAYSEEDRALLEMYRKQGESTRAAARAPAVDYRIIEGEELRHMEPSLSKKAVCALRAPDTGRVIPYEMGIALWESALAGGVELKLNTRVKGLHRNGPSWTVETDDTAYRAGFIINAAGHGSNALGMAAGFEDSRIHSVKGQYLIYNRNRSFDVENILFQVPERGTAKAGKGILVCKTVYGNLMIGPDAEWIGDDGDTGTDETSLRSVLEGAQKSIPALDPKGMIKSFAGIRPKPEGGDFIIEEKGGFVHLCGIESPGLTSSPAIAEEVVSLLSAGGLKLKPKPPGEQRRVAIVKERLNLPPDELKRRVNLDEDDPERIICRCEQVPRIRILDSLSRGLPVTTLDAVKRRTRAGQGPCQGGFCGARVRKLLAAELNLPEEEITQRGDEPLGKRVKRLKES